MRQHYLQCDGSSFSYIIKILYNSRKTKALLIFIYQHQTFQQKSELMFFKSPAFEVAICETERMFNVPDDGVDDFHVNLYY